MSRAGGGNARGQTRVSLMSRSVWILAAVLATALLAPVGTAGTAADPELTDPAGDTTTTLTCEAPSCLSQLYDPDASHAEKVDILSAYVTETASDRYAVSVVTSAAGDDLTEVTVGFTIEQGPTSIFGSTADGQTFTAKAEGATLAEGPNGTTVTRDGATLTFSFTRAETNVSGGDLLTDLTVDAFRSETTGSAPQEGTQTIVDGAPESNVTVRAFTFDRPPIVGGAELTLLNATVTETIPRELADGETVLSDPDAANDTVTRTRTVEDDTIKTYDRDATVTFLLRLENTGSDTDTFSLAIFDPTIDEVGGTIVSDDNQTREVQNATLTLDPGATGEAQLTVELTDAPVGKYATIVQVASGNNGTASLGVLVERLEASTTPPEDEEPPVDDDDGPAPTGDEREPLSGLGWLTPAAEATGFDEAFGDYAELVLLALLLLLLLVVVFLVLALVRSRWVAVRVTPRTVDAAPGSTAEFQVEVRNRKRHFRGALARFEQQPGWKTGVLLRDDDGTAIEPLLDEADERELGLSGRRQHGDTLAGTLRVQVPEDAEPGERGHVTLSVVPIGDDGRERPRKGGNARVRIQAAGAAGAGGRATKAARDVPVRLREVRHDPEAPNAGDVVTTTATLANDSDSETMRLRVVLQLDGEDADEEVVELPPRSARGVIFRWLADEGSNRVRVQVYEAD